jgi:hypothetical protein
MRHIIRHKILYYIASVTTVSLGLQIVLEWH